MKRILLSFLLASIGMTGFCTTHIVTTPGFVFSPATITIQLGDSVRFNIGGIHRVEEVSQATWNANNSTPLPGFNAPFGGGLILPAQLTVGAHWYVCTPHASSGMKGMIIVENTTSIGNQPTATAFNLFPNPSNGIFQLEMEQATDASNFQMDVINSEGRKVYAVRNLEQRSLHEIDLTTFSKGIYFVRVYDGSGIFSRKVLIQ
jgi:plastocyanin